jgi:hypothetical protein
MHGEKAFSIENHRKRGKTGPTKALACPCEQDEVRMRWG